MQQQKTPEQVRQANVERYFSEVSHCNFAQRTNEWYEKRLGVPSASRFSEVIRRRTAQNKRRSTYMNKLIAERITKTREIIKATDAMKRGLQLEAPLRDYHARQNNLIIRECGVFMGKGISPKGRGIRMCASPDGLIDDTGLIEIKTTNPHNMVSIFQNPEDRVKEYYVDQIQGQLMLTGRNWCQLLVFASDNLPMLTMKIERDETYIEFLFHEIVTFIDEMHDALARIAGSVYSNRRYVPTKIENLATYGGVSERIVGEFPGAKKPEVFVDDTQAQG